MDTSRPFNPPPRLVDPSLPPPGFISVRLTRGYPATPAALDLIERLWRTDRARLESELATHGETLESSHWDWTRKARQPADYHCLVTIEWDGQVQGIMAAKGSLTPARLTPDARVMYVDFIESAPWNHRVPQDRNKPAVRRPKYSGVGTLLIGEAIRMSIGRAAGGRVGLHGLPQAEAFYTGRCGMTDLGPDPHYGGLVYFEYADGVAAERLTALGLSA